MCCDSPQVLQIFEEIQKRHRHGQQNEAFETDITDAQRQQSVSLTDLCETNTDSGFGHGTPADSLSSLENDDEL